MNQVTTFELSDLEIHDVNGGIICGGLCILGAVAAGATILASGVVVGQALR